MLGPQSPLLFVVLLLVFLGLVYWLIRTKRIVWQAVAAVTAFVPPLLFGVAAVNRYYDYYASWDDVWGELSDSAPAKTVSIPDLAAPGALDKTLEKAAEGGKTAKTGLLFSSLIPGAKSGIERVGVVYLPPQYFQSKFAKLRFPVMELLHGGPGTPSDYTRVLKVSQVYLDLLNSGQAKPAVLVIPDTNGGRDIALQCLDTVKGPQDETYLVNDLPGLLTKRLRVQPPGPGWGIAGYSEGGYCAANLGLRHPQSYGLAGVMSGYFEPLPFSKLPNRVDPFGGNRQLRAANTPSLLARTLPASAHPPAFWLMTGSGSKRDLTSAQNFAASLRRFQPGLSLIVVKGGRHDYQAWRKALPGLLSWATARLPYPRP